jgi:hypothetical protein
MYLVELYFYDPDKPAGSRFLGAVLMQDSGQDVRALAKRAWDLGANPGGAMTVYSVDSVDLVNFSTDNHLDRLLLEQECLALNLFKRN